MTTKTKTILDTATLANICLVAMERFRDNAKTMEQVGATGGNGMITPEAAKRLAEQFEVQAREAQLFSYMLNDCGTLEIEFDTSDWEDDDIKEALRV